MFNIDEHLQTHLKVKRCIRVEDMVLTKAEQGQINDLKDQYLDLRKLIEQVGDSVKEGISAQLQSLKSDLTTKINGVETKLSNDLQLLRDNINAEVQTLRDENIQIRKMMDASQETSTREIDNIRADLVRVNVEKTDELETANEQIVTLTRKIVSLEKQCHRGLQHGRGWNIEIDGIPREVGEEPLELKKALCDIFEVFNIDVSEDEIEAIHRLPSRLTCKPVIARFYSRESVNEIHQKKNRLRNLADRVADIDVHGVDENTQIFIRASQCSYYAMLSYNCRVLKRKKLISGVSVSNDGRVSIKLENGTFVKIDHESTLMQHFPNFDGFSFSYGEKGQ